MPTGVSTRPCFSASLRAASRPASERSRKASSVRAAWLAPISLPSRENAAIGISMPSTSRCSRSISGMLRPTGSATATRMPWLPSAKSSRAQPQVTSAPRLAPKPRSRSSRIAPEIGSRLASCATWRRCGSAGPKILFANSGACAAPNRLAPTGLAHRIRVPSGDHSQAGCGLVACTASRGSPTPRSWNSIGFIAVT